MNAKKMNLLLIEKFPQLKTAYDEEVSWQDGDETGAHVVYGDVFVPFIEETIQNCKSICEIIDFIESILQMKADYSDEVIYSTVLYDLILNDTVIEKDIFPHLKPLSKKAWNALKKDLL